MRALTSPLPLSQLAGLARSLASLALERPHDAQSCSQPAAGPGPSSLRQQQPRVSGIRAMCRWLGETRCATVTAVDLAVGTVAPSPATVAASIMESKVHSDQDVRMDAQVIFESCWRRFEERFRLRSVHVPREVVWLNGAPGAGKGANTQHILKTRGLDHSVNLSSMLQTNEGTRELIERGELIPDSMVGDVVLEALLFQSCQIPECGVLVDGFPRTAMQVDFLKLLYDKLDELHGIFTNTTHRNQFPRPLFKVVMLYIDEDTSLLRQLERAKMASVHNKRVLDAGAGQLWEQRSTDLSLEKAKKRYSIFRQHHSAVLRLKQFFPFHLIDAMGTLAETQEAITTEL
ncbi:adenylate kinase, partial [Tetrabaena socialis]